MLLFHIMAINAIISNLGYIRGYIRGLYDLHDMFFKLRIAFNIVDNDAFNF